MTSQYINLPSTSSFLILCKLSSHSTPTQSRHKTNYALAACIERVGRTAVLSFAWRPILHTTLGISLLKFRQPTSLLAERTRRTTYVITMGVFRRSRRLTEVFEDPVLSVGAWCQTFGGKIVVSSSGVEFMTVKDEITMLSPNVEQQNTQ